MSRRERTDGPSNLVLYIVTEVALHTTGQTLTLFKNCRVACK